MAKNTTRMKVGAGTTEVSVGGEMIEVAGDGTVEVPSEAVAAVESAGVGTVDAEPVKADPPAEGAPAPALAKLVSPHGGPGSLSWGGSTYQVNEAGEVEVPHAAVADLIAHGFAPA